jgi:hypothetical protein
MTAVAEQSVVQQQQPPPPPPPPAPLRLRVSRKDAAAQMQNQIKIGRAIKGQRIRDRWELDQARAEKQEWVRRATETLDALFNQPAVGEKFNAWVAPILPEYAEFDMFVALFADEMGQRLEKLQNLLKNLDAVPEPPEAIMCATSAAQREEEENAVKADAAPAAIDQALSAAASTSPSIVRTTVTRGALIVRTSQPAVADALSRFLSQLGIELTTVDCSTAAPHASVIEALSAHDQMSFAVIVAASPAAAGESSSSSSSSDATARDGEDLFDLGCCVGRLGTRGVCVVHPHGCGAHAVDARGVQHIVIDGSDGWQLALARHLRRGGVNVDLNKLAEC